MEFGIISASGPATAQIAFRVATAATPVTKKDADTNHPKYRTIAAQSFDRNFFQRRTYE